jgi:signal transduction histidine kinase
MTVLGAYALVGGLVSFLGWAADAQRLTDWEGKGVSIQPNTTVAVTACGAAVLALAWERRRTAAVLGVVVAAIGATVVFEWVSGIDLGIDGLLLFGRTWGRVGVVVPGRMGPPGSVSWTLLGASIVLASTAPIATAGRRAALVLACVAAAIAGLSIVGWFYGVEPLYMLPRLTIIAIQTSSFVLAVALAMIADARELAPTRWLVGDGAAAVLARRALPFVVMVPLLVGWLRIRGQELGLYGTTFGTTIFTLVLVGALVALVTWNIRTVEAKEDALRRADRHKNEFLATLSHELRGPLAPLRNMVEVLKRTDPGQADVRQQALSTMERQIAHMTRLVDDLLDVSRIAKDKIVLRKQRTDLSAVLGHSIEACRPLLEQSGQRLEVKLPSVAVAVDVDPARLVQVFSNVLNNASKFSEPGGRIELTAAPENGVVSVSIRDYGAGIPPEKIGSIFEMFGQLDRTLERSNGGLGIGLTLARRFVEMHGGTLTARSEGAGHGSEFVVRLPVLPQTGD